MVTPSKNGVPYQTTSSFPELPAALQGKMAVFDGRVERLVNYVVSRVDCQTTYLGFHLKPFEVSSVEGVRKLKECLPSVVAACHEDVETGGYVVRRDTDFARALSRDPRPVVDWERHAGRIDCPGLTTVTACALFHCDKWTSSPLKADNVDVVEAVAVLLARNRYVGVATIRRESGEAGECGVTGGR